MRRRMRAYNRGHRYQLAISCGISPSTFSSWANGVYQPSFNDERAIRLGAQLGMSPDEVFATNEGAATPTPNSEA